MNHQKEKQQQGNNVEQAIIHARPEELKQLYQLEEESLIQRSIEILKEGKQQRSQLALITLQYLFQKLPFYQNLKESVRPTKEETLQNFINNLQVRFVQRGEVIYNYGSKMQYIFILLNGEFSRYAEQTQKEINQQAYWNNELFKITTEMKNQGVIGIIYSDLNNLISKIEEYQLDQKRSSGGTKISNFSQQLSRIREIIQFYQNSEVDDELLQIEAINSYKYFLNGICQFQKIEQITSLHACLEPLSRVNLSNTNGNLNNYKPSLRFYRDAMITSREGFIAYMQADKYFEFIHELSSVDPMMVSGISQAFPFATRDTILGFENKSEQSVYRLREVIFDENEDSHHFYVILKGQVLIKKKLLKVAEKQRSQSLEIKQQWNITINTLGPSCMFGHQEFQQNHLRFYSAVSDSDETRVLQIDNFVLRNLRDSQLLTEMQKNALQTYNSYMGNMDYLVNEIQNNSYKNKFNNDRNYDNGDEIDTAAPLASGPIFHQFLQKGDGIKPLVDSAIQKLQMIQQINVVPEEMQIKLKQSISGQKKIQDINEQYLRHEIQDLNSSSPISTEYKRKTLQKLSILKQRMNSTSNFKTTLSDRYRLNTDRRAEFEIEKSADNKEEKRHVFKIPFQGAKKFDNDLFTALRTIANPKDMTGSQVYQESFNVANQINQNYISPQRENREQNFKLSEFKSSLKAPSNPSTERRRIMSKSWSSISLAEQNSKSTERAKNTNMVEEIKLTVQGNVTNRRFDNLSTAQNKRDNIAKGRLNFEHLNNIMWRKRTKVTLSSRMESGFQDLLIEAQPPTMDEKPHIFDYFENNQEKIQRNIYFAKMLQGQPIDMNVQDLYGHD